MYRKTPPTGTEKLEFYLIWSLLVISIIGLGMLFVLSSSGAEVPRGGPLSPEVNPPHSPHILTQNRANKVLNLWAEPGSEVVVVYDQWQILIYGNDSDPYSVEINGRERINSTLEGQYTNLSWDASRISQAVVKVKVANRSYTFGNLIINHQAVGFDDEFMNPEKEQFTVSDLNKARLKAAAGVVIASLISIPVVWKGVRAWRDRQGVRQI